MFDLQASVNLSFASVGILGFRHTYTFIQSEREREREREREKVPKSSR